MVQYSTLTPWGGGGLCLMGLFMYISYIMEDEGGGPVTKHDHITHNRH